jgi:hypothetical protein
MCGMRIAILALLVACGDPAPPGWPRPPKPPTLADLAWLAGTWHSALLDSHWEMVDGALYGIAFDGNGFEVNIIDDSDDDGKPAPITLVSMVNGRDPMRFELVSASHGKMEFADAKHRTVRVTNVGDGWRGEFVDEPPRHPTVFRVSRGKLDPAEQLQEADRAFAADTAKDGADGWARWFTADGAMWRNGRIEGAAIKDAIGKTLARGPLQWTPVSSGAKGEWGYTLGRFTHGAAHGSYCTIWNRQGDGSWKVVFDIGRPA